MGDLFDIPALSEKLEGIVEWKNITTAGYGGEKIVDADMPVGLKSMARKMLPYICDTTEYLLSASHLGKILCLKHSWEL